MMTAGKDKRILIVCIAIVAMLYLPMAAARLHFPDLDHGDEYQDGIIMISGINFVRFGFIKTCFLPLFDLQQDSPHDLYTHYPPLPFIMNGVFRGLFHTDSLVLFRLISLCLSFAGILFWFFFVRRISDSSRLAFLCTLLYMTNTYFIYGMDSLSEFMYADFFLAAILFVFAMAAHAPAQRRGRWHAALWLLMFVESYITFEYAVYLTLFFILYRYLIKSPKRYPSWKSIIVFSCAPVAGFVLHLLQNAWYFGGINSAIGDLLGSAAYRMGGKNETSLNFSLWFREVIVRNISLSFMFNYFVLLVCAFCAYVASGPLAAPQKQKVRFLLKML